MTACDNKRKPYACKNSAPKPTIAGDGKVYLTLAKRNFLQSAFYENIMDIRVLRTNHTSM